MQRRKSCETWKIPLALKPGGTTEENVGTSVQAERGLTQFCYIIQYYCILFSHLVLDLLETHL